MPVPGGVLQGTINGASRAEVEQFARETADLIDRPLSYATFDAAPEAADTRRVTVQLRNRRKALRQERRAVLLWVSNGTDATPSNSQTLSVVTGVLLQTLTANQCLVVLCDATGKIVLDVTVTGASARSLNVVDGGRLDQSDPIAWA